MAPPTATATTTSTATYKEGPKEEVVRMDATQREDEGEMECQLASLSRGPNPLTGE